VADAAEAAMAADVGPTFLLPGEAPGGPPQARANHILMRGDAEYAGKQPQEMKRADAGFPSDTLQLDLAMRIRLDPKRGVHGAPTIPRAEACWLTLFSCDQLDKAMCKQ